MMQEELLSISEMAKLHNLTRQTLIYYDSIGLLKPVFISEASYRYYSIYQIPILREICLLKKLGMKLEDIKKSFENRSPNSVLKMLQLQKNTVEKQIEDLDRTRRNLEQKIRFYKDFHEEQHSDTPMIKHIGPRKVLFVPFPSEPCKSILHLTLMQAWNQLFNGNVVPSGGFGTLIRHEQFDLEDLYTGAGIFVVLPNEDCDLPGVEEISGGEFACLYKYSFPYHQADFDRLKHWVQSQNYEITGDALDLCLLDTTFYNAQHEVDYCCLQIPVRKKT